MLSIVIVHCFAKINGLVVLLLLRLNDFIYVSKISRNVLRKINLYEVLLKLFRPSVSDVRFLMPSY